MPPQAIPAPNRLYYGDNLTVLRDYIPSQSVDLIYLDPPFNSRQDYNVLFAEKDGARSASQITAFKDTWEWNQEAARAYEEVVEAGGPVAEAMRAFRTLLLHSESNEAITKPTFPPHPRRSMQGDPWETLRSMNWRTAARTLLLVTLAIPAGCGGGGVNGSAGGGGGGNPPTNTAIASVTVTCGTTTCAAQTGHALQFTATVTCDVAGECNTGVTWYVDAVAGGNTTDGTIGASGVYTAPTAAPSGGAVTIKALGSDSSTSGTAAVNVTQAPVLVAYTNLTPGTCDYGYGCSNIYVFDLSAPSTGTQLLPQSSYQYGSIYSSAGVAISPDQSTTAYLASPVGVFSDLFELSSYTVPTVGGTQTPVSDWSSPYTVDSIDWKPDGSQFVISYWDQKNEVAGIATMSLDGKTITPIAVTNIACVVGACSPPDAARYLIDDRIAYVKQVGSQGDAIYVASADGKTQTNISNDSSVVVYMGAPYNEYSYVNDTDPSPSPDGTKIVFQTNRDGIYDLYVENIDGTNPLPLVQTSASQPVWCPGDKIVFVGGATGTLFSVNSDGTGKTSLNIQGNAPYCR